MNPNYYPEPIREVPSKSEGIVNDLVAINDGFLTKDELIAFHGKIGNILHARNPYKKSLDYSEYEKQIPEILEKIKCLLNCNKIKLLGDHDFFYLIHMKEERGNHVHYYKFKEIKGQSGKGEFFSPLPHTTQRAGPHRAVPKDKRTVVGLNIPHSSLNK